MKSKVKILIIAFAYLLNFVHDVQPHDHDTIICCDKIVSIVVNYFNANDCDQKDACLSNEDHHDHNLPFHHHHIVQFQDYLQFRNITNNLMKLDIPQIFIKFYNVQPSFQLIYINIGFDIKQLYLSTICSNNSLRAPPVI